MKSIKIFKATNLFFVLSILLATLTNVSCTDPSLQNQNLSNTPVLSIMLEENFRTVGVNLSLNQLSNFKLTGKKAGDETVITFGNSSGYATAAALTGAAITLPEDAAGNSWELTLTAECTAGGVTKTYTSTITKTIKAGQNAVKFTYTFESEYNEGNGSFSVILDWTEITESSDKVNNATFVFENMDGTEVEASIKNKITQSSITDNTFNVSGSDIPAGTYRLRMSLNKNEAQVAYWQEVVKIAGGFSSTKTRTIQGFLDAYHITYHWDNDVTDFENCPTTASVVTDLLANGTPKKEGYTFLNFYTDSACTKRFDIKKLCADTDLYAKWFNVNDPHTATKDTIASKIAAANSTDILNPFGIKLFGPYTYDNFTSTAEALEARNSDNVYIALDFSEVDTDIEDFRFFSSCSRLAAVTIPDSVLPYKSDNHGITGITFCDAENLQNIYTSDNNPNYSSIEGVLCNKSGTKIVAFPCGKTCTNSTYNTPDSVTEIEANAFYGANLKINTVIIGENVTTINSNAFNNAANITVSFDDKTHAWKCRDGYGLYFDIENQVKKNLEKNNVYTLTSGYSKQNKTFTEVLTEIQPSQVDVISGAGDDEENFDLNTIGFNTFTIQTPGYGTNYAEKWYWFTTEPGHTYYLYLCGGNTISSYSNIQNPNEIWNSVQLNVYSGDGSCCIDRLGSIEESNVFFTAEEKQGVDNVAYIYVAAGGSFGITKKVYLLIRDVAP